MRQIFINAGLATVISAILAIHGMGFESPFFWIVVACIFGIVFNSSVD